jgi:hypothetical protein
MGMALEFTPVSMGASLELASAAVALSPQPTDNDPEASSAGAGLDCGSSEYRNHMYWPTYCSIPGVGATIMPGFSGTSLESKIMGASLVPRDTRDGIEYGAMGTILEPVCVCWGTLESPISPSY